MSTPNPQSLPRLAFHINELAQATGTNRVLLYAEIKAGRLQSFKLGRRRMVSAQAARDWIERVEREAAA